MCFSTAAHRVDAPAITSLVDDDAARGDRRGVDQGQLENICVAQSPRWHECDEAIRGVLARIRLRLSDMPVRRVQTEAGELDGVRPSHGALPLLRGREDRVRRQPRFTASVARALSRADRAAQARNTRVRRARPRGRRRQPTNRASAGAAGRRSRASTACPWASRTRFDVRGLPTRVISALFADRIGEVDARARRCVASRRRRTRRHDDDHRSSRWRCLRRPAIHGISRVHRVALRRARPRPWLPHAARRDGEPVRWLGDPARVDPAASSASSRRSARSTDTAASDPVLQSQPYRLLGGCADADVWETAHHIGAGRRAGPGIPAIRGSRQASSRARPASSRGSSLRVGENRRGRRRRRSSGRLLQLRSRGTEIVEPVWTASSTLTRPRRPRRRILLRHRAASCAGALRPMSEMRPDAVSAGVRGYYRPCRTSSPSMSTVRRSRDVDRLRAQHRALAGRVDAFITLARIGPGQKGHPPVRTPRYNDASSAIGAPTLNLPLLSVEGVPLGVQLSGFEARTPTSCRSWRGGCSKPAAPPTIGLRLNRDRAQRPAAL